MINKAGILRNISYHSQFESLIKSAADDVEALERVRALIEEAKEERRRQPYDAMGVGAGIPLSKLIAVVDPPKAEAA